MSEIVRPGEGSQNVRVEDRGTRRVHVKNHAHYVYVLEFSTGVVKVGQSMSPRRRIEQHRVESRRFGASVLRHWTSPAHKDATASEQQLIDWCRKRGRQDAGVEYFRGVDYSDVVHQARSLAYPPVEPDYDVEVPKRSLIGPDNVPWRVHQEGMELAIGLSLGLWESILAELGGMDVSGDRLRKSRRWSARGPDRRHHQPGGLAESLMNGFIDGAMRPVAGYTEEHRHLFDAAWAGVSSMRSVS